MKEFTIVFQTISGQKCMKIVTNNKDSANKAFLLECTRRGMDFIQILDIQCTDVNVRPTLDQEKKALRQIEAILEDIGNKSHLAAAFDGCVEIARRNLDLDSYDSYVNLLEFTSKRLTEANKNLTEVETRYRNFCSRIQRDVARNQRMKEFQVNYIYADHLSVHYVVGHNIEEARAAFMKYIDKHQIEAKHIDIVECSSETSEASQLKLQIEQIQDECNSLKNQLNEKCALLEDEAQKYEKLANEKESEICKLRFELDRVSARNRMNCNLDF